MAPSSELTDGVIVSSFWVCNLLGGDEQPQVLRDPEILFLGIYLMDVSAWTRIVLGSTIFFVVLSMTTRTEAVCLLMGTDRLGLLNPREWSAAGGFI